MSRFFIAKAGGGDKAQAQISQETESYKDVARSKIFQGLLGIDELDPIGAMMQLYGPVGTMADAAGSQDRKNAAFTNMGNRSNERHKLNMAMANKEYRDSITPASVKRGAGFGDFDSKLARRVDQGPTFGQIRQQERGNDIRAAAERRRRFLDSQMATGLLQKLGLGGMQRTTEETEEIFNRAGAPERVPIKTTRTQTMSPSEQAQLLQIIMGMR